MGVQARCVTNIVRSLFVRDEGQDVIEYALLVGLAATAGALVLPPLGARLADVYAAWTGQANDLWIPPPPS